MSSVHPSAGATATCHARATMAFDRACQLTGLSKSELCRRLSQTLDRDHVLSRQTLAAWRRGEQAVPFAAFMAAADLAGLRPPAILALAATEFDATALRGDLNPERG